jgi:integrase
VSGSEVAGLPWTELDLDEALLTVLETAPDDEYEDPDDPKSEAGSRTMSLDPGSVDVLLDWQDRQDKERAAAGTAWVDSGMVFTQPDGSELRPEWASQRFDELVKKYNAIRRGHADGKTVEYLAKRHRVSEDAVRVALEEPLPPIRFHDLRHGAATLSLAAGVELKVVSETLGHSKSSFTRDVYTSVVPEVHQAAAEAVVNIVPRRSRTDRRGLDRPPSARTRQSQTREGRG